MARRMLWRLAVAIGAIVLVSVVVAHRFNDTTPKEVTTAEFQAIADRPAESMRSTRFMGVENGKAIIEVSSMSLVNPKKWHTERFVTDVDKLPADWLAKQSDGTKRDAIVQPPTEPKTPSR